MAQGAPPIVVKGNLTKDPILRFTPSGLAVTNISIANTPRHYNRDTQEWEDGETLFLRGSIWRDPAEHVANSFHKGDQVIVTGTLVVDNYETKDGEKRSGVKINIDDVAGDTQFATLKVTKAQSGGGSRRRRDDEEDERPARPSSRRSRDDDDRPVRTSSRSRRDDADDEDDRPRRSAGRRASRNDAPTAGF